MQACAKGGAGAYSGAFQRDPPTQPSEEGEGAVSGLRSSGVVGASHFRTYHPPLNSQDDFIQALARVSVPRRRCFGVGST